MRPTPRSSGKTTPSRSGTACSAPSPLPGTWTSSTAHGSSRPRTWPPPMPRSAAGTTSTTGTSGARSPPSARPRATETGQPGPTRHGHRCSIRPRRWPRPPRSSRRRSPSTPPATTARAARSSGRCRTSSAPTGSPSARLSNKSGTTRTFHRFSDALEENINARVWAGIHFRTADIQGAKLGNKVARYLHKHYLQPVHHHPPDPRAVPTSRRPPGHRPGGRRRTGRGAHRASIVSWRRPSPTDPMVERTRSPF